MKKTSLILLALGIVLIIIPLAFPNIFKEKKNDDVVNNDPTDKITWEVLSGKDIVIEDPGYNTESYSTAYFNSVFNGANKYWFIVPTENKLTKVGNDEFKYAGSVSVDYGADGFTNVKDYYISYAKEYETENIYIAKRKINDKSFAINIKANDTENNNYSEELLILYEDVENNYSFVRYKIDNRCFSEEFIEKVISEFKIENNKAVYTTCKEENGQYNCGFNIDSIGKKIDFKINNALYQLETETQHDNYTEKFAVINNDSENIDAGRISVSINLSSDLSAAIENHYSDLGYKKKELNLDGVKVIKYYLEGVGENNDRPSYSANYIIYLNSDVAMHISIMSGKDNLDDFIKDFTEYNLVDM